MAGEVRFELPGPREHAPVMEVPRDPRGSMWADEVTVGDDVVGLATSRRYSCSFREMLSLGTIDVVQSEPGTEATVHWGTPHRPQEAHRARGAPGPLRDRPSPQRPADGLLPSAPAGRPAQPVR